MASCPKCHALRHHECTEADCDCACRPSRAALTAVRAAAATHAVEPHRAVDLYAHLRTTHGPTHIPIAVPADIAAEACIRVMQLGWRPLPAVSPEEPS